MSQNLAAESQHVDVHPQRSRLRCMWGLVRKETYQMLRDPSSVGIGIALPLLLLFLFTYAISLDVRNIKLGVVCEDNSPIVNRLLASFQNNKYFMVHVARDRREVQDDLVGGRLNGVLVIPADFASRIERRSLSPLQLLVRGSDVSTAALVQNYVRGVLRHWLIQEGLNAGQRNSGEIVRIESRVWFNQEIESRAALLPGSIAVIMTLIGTLLTALVVAREWERGTMEALLATPITRMDIVLSKFVPYFILGMLAMGLVAAVSTLGLGVPLRGSLWVLIMVSATFLCSALGLGLLISSVTRNQFVASQVALIVGYLPALILSGLVFEIDSMPRLIQYLTCVMPPRYFVSALRTLFLAGNVWQVILPNTVVLLGFAAFFLTVTIQKTKMNLE